MNAARKRICLVLVSLAMVSYAAALVAREAIEPDRAKASPQPLIQVAILLDTSGSMSGLIEQAKSQLWKIVNEFATASQAGKTPELQVALYEYGKDSIPASEGHLRMILPLTTDLDKVSEELFVLRTNGGQEYCGKVIKAATESLTWSASNSDLKAIFIAGNEPFTQGNVPYGEACKAAIAKGITINTIFCGKRKEGINTKWEHGATLADGKYMHIDHNAKVVQIAAPQDAELARLGQSLNTTYIAYGPRGRVAAERQIRQDKNARGVSVMAFSQRQSAKASTLYDNASWDLVDAEKKGKVELEALAPKDLPEEMRRMNVEERKAHVQAKAKERAAIQTQIKKLTVERRKYVAEALKKRGKSGDNTLDAAIIATVREQAARKSFTFGK